MTEPAYIITLHAHGVANAVISDAIKPLPAGDRLTLKGLRLALTGADIQKLDLTLTAGMLKKIKSKLRETQMELN